MTSSAGTYSCPSIARGGECGIWPLGFLRRRVLRGQSYFPCQGEGLLARDSTLPEAGQITASSASGSHSHPQAITIPVRIFIGCRDAAKTEHEPQYSEYEVSKKDAVALAVITRPCRGSGGIPSWVWCQCHPSLSPGRRSSCARVLTGFEYHRRLLGEGLGPAAGPADSASSFAGAALFAAVCFLIAAVATGLGTGWGRAALGLAGVSLLLAALAWRFIPSLAVDRKDRR